MINWFKKHNKVSWAITILFAVLIFSFSSITFEGVRGYGGVKNWMSITYHIVIFFLLSLFFLISLINEKNKNLFIFSGFVLISYAIIDEMHQFFVPGRFCSLIDVAFDLIGILFAFQIYIIYTKIN